MEVKDIIALCIGGVILIGIIAYMVINQKSKVMEWLKYAVAEAEKILGSGTGQMKLRMVYDWFCEQFPWIAAILPFPVFSAWVDVAIQTLDEWLDSNKDISAYITGGGSNDSKSN